jgi:hypothetical protein
MKLNRHTAVLALVVLSVSWSSWVFFSSWHFGLGLSEATLGLLDDLFDSVQDPLDTLDDHHPERPRFSLMPMPAMEKISLPANTGAINTVSNLKNDTSKPSLDMFSEIYVISLPSRNDRRASMELIRQVVPQLSWSYFDATPADDPRIVQIMAHIRYTREQYSSSTSPPTETFSWPIDLPSLASKLAGADLWASPTEDTADHDSPHGFSMSLSLSASDAPGLGPPLAPLTCASRDRVQGPLYSPALPPYMLLTPSKIACWHAHVRLLRRIAAGGSDGDNSSGDATEAGAGRAIAEAKQRARDREVVLILEDDVDVERDLAERLQGIWATLPATWDMLFLGTCALLCFGCRKGDVR